MLRITLFSCFLATLLLGLPDSSHAQSLAPVIQLSAEESANVRQLAQTLKSARNRKADGEAAWNEFHAVYKASHPLLGEFRFTSDFKTAVAHSPAPASDVHEAVVVELTSGDKQKVESLFKELIDSRDSLTAAQSAWTTYLQQLLAAHAAKTTMRVGTVWGSDSVTIPQGWENGVMFSPDFRLAVPN